VSVAAHPTARDPAAAAPAPRSFGPVNWRGVWSLYRREMLRFFRYAGESIAGPAVSSLMFLAVFHLALGGAGSMVGGVTLTQFIAPGIVMFSLTHSAFEGAAITIFYDKLEGMIGDILGAPLTPLETLSAYILGAASNALITATVILILMAIFVDLPLHAPVAILVFAAAGALLFALVGAIVGICAERWDHYSAAETFLVFPVAILSGAFFAVAALPADVRWLFAANPVFHALEGFRYGFTGQAEESLLVALAVLLAQIAALGGLAWRLFAAGYKLKA
jgi:ABC-2 type transport system permease protein